MDIGTIIRDAKEDFLQKGNSEFWIDDGNPDEVFQEILAERNISNGADMFSLILAVLTETSGYFKQMGKVSIRLWKPVLKKISNNIFNQLELDYASYMKELRIAYKSPMPEVLMDADNFLNKIKELKPIKAMVSGDDKETEEYIRVTASGYVDGMLKLFSSLDMIDTPYMTGIEAIDMYKQTVVEAFDMLIELSMDSKGDKDGNE